MDADLQPEGEPLYVPMARPEHTYPYGYAYPVTTLVGEPSRRSDPRTGWLLTAVAVLALTATMFPWATLYYTDGSDDEPTSVEVVHGYDGLLGPPTVILATLTVALGVVIGLRRGGAWVSILSLAASSVQLVFILVKSATIDLSVFLTLGDSTRGPAYWVALIATAALVVLSIFALALRAPAVPPSSP